MLIASSAQELISLPAKGCSQPCSDSFLFRLSQAYNITFTFPLAKCCHLFWGGRLEAKSTRSIKSRLQADGQGQRRYRGLLHCVVTSVREEGPRVLFKGLSLNCCRAFPVNMVVFVTYEAVLRLMQGLLS